ncbi:hypothetical protein HK105_205136 [Polyrhizophydium stewartii]|uniref:Uncharacterized protein n=1 Tax=Polyrhizophydium stewartii TaxID=2732419 RepID=A0ABR4N723_9FUNG
MLNAAQPTNSAPVQAPPAQPAPDVAEAVERLSRPSARIAAQSVLTAGVMGAAGGAVAGGIQGVSLSAAAFGMGINWLVMTTPFFVFRESTLQYRYWRNALGGVESLSRKDRDDMIATTTAGLATGAMAGYIWRGPLAIPSGALMYACVAAAGQAGISWLRNVRLEAAVAEMRKQSASAAASPSLHPDGSSNIVNNGVTKTPDDAGLYNIRPAADAGLAAKTAWLQNRWRDVETEDLSMQSRPATEWDPFGDLMQWILGGIRARLDLDPKWSSPLFNAFDIDHRKTLNVKISILELQVRELRDEIGRIERTSGRSVRELLGQDACADSPGK